MQLKKRLREISPLKKLEENYEKAIKEIVIKLKKNKKINSIILFGSFARKDYSVRYSDIDLFIIFDLDKKDKNLEEKLNKIAIEIGTKHKVSIHLTFQYLKIGREDLSLIKKMSVEGKVLYTKNTLVVSKNILGLGAYELIIFDTKNISQLNRTKFSRLLHGAKLWYYKDNKKITKEYKGIIDEDDFIECGKGCLLVKINKVNKLVALAEELGIKIRSKGLFYR